MTDRIEGPEGIPLIPHVEAEDAPHVARGAIPPAPPAPPSLAPLAVNPTATQASEEIEQRRALYLHGVMAMYSSADAEPALRADLPQRLEAARDEWNAVHARLFERLKGALKDVPDGQEHTIRQKIAEGQLATSTRRMHEGRVLGLQAIYERKFALEAKYEKLDKEVRESVIGLVARIKRWLVGRKLKSAEAPRFKQTLEMIQKLNPEGATHAELRQAAEGALRLADMDESHLQAKTILFLLDQLDQMSEELAKAPSSDYLAHIQANIASGLMSPAQILSHGAAKKAQKKYDKELAWGESHINQALAAPSNWTDIYAVSLRRGKDGRLHAFATELKPLGTRNPSSMRTVNPETPTNLWKETSYLIGREDEPFVLFRGGQFPTEAAAKEAVRLMRENGAEGKVLHNSALLTPAAIGVPDRKMLREQKAHFLAADEDAIVSNFGVNEGAVGEKRLLGKDLRAGWHTSILDYTNDAIARLNQALPQQLKGHLLKMARRLDQIWSQNLFADASSTDNQFEAPALWAAIDHFLGIIDYLHCKSGKDRTGQTVAYALHLMHEAMIEVEDEALHDKPVFDKKDDVSYRNVRMDTSGLSTYEPASQPVEVTPAERHRLAMGRRAAILGSGSLDITQRNTGKTGFKVKGGDPLARHCAGFDIDYVAETATDWEAFSLMTGLYELSSGEQELIQGRFTPDGDNSALLLEVAHLKTKAIAPMVKVAT